MSVPPSDESEQPGAEERALPWEPAAEGTLTSLVDMVPQTIRELARSTGRDEAELAAQERGADTVEGEDVIRGWVRTTPPEQRDGLVSIIDDLGFDPELFASDLESNTGWEEQAED